MSGRHPRSFVPGTPGRTSAHAGIEFKRSERSRMWIRILFAAAFLMLGLAPAHAQEIRAWLDRNEIQSGETVTLNIEVKDRQDLSPDLSVLEADFVVLGTSSNTSYSLGGGQRSMSLQWAIGLEPRRTGELRIPPIPLGDNLATSEIGLKVVALATPADEARDVFVEFDLEPRNPYVQQQMYASVRLFYALPLTEGNLAEPVADGLLVQRLREDTSYQTTRGNRRYQVLERRYALIPERSGTMEIGPIRFVGRVSRRGAQSLFDRGQRVDALAEAHRIEVRARPADAGEPWLPARSLVLSDELSETRVQVGQPVTRTLKMRASGLGEAQLPELRLEAGRDFNVYPDQSETRGGSDEKWLAAERTQRFAIVPQREGKLRLPAVRVAWWNTELDRAEYAEVPAREIDVLPVAQNGAAAATAATPEAGALARGEARIADGAGLGSFELRLWQAATALFALLWLATMLWMRGRVPPAAQPSTEHEKPDVRSARKHVDDARRQLDWPAAQRALLSLVRAQQPQRAWLNLAEIEAALGDPDQRATLSALRARLAGREDGPDPGAGLAAIANKGLAFDLRNARPASVLPGLYPPRS